MVSDIQMYLLEGTRTIQERLAIMRIQHRIPILPNNKQDVEVYCDKELPYQTTPSIIQSATLANESKDIDIEPTLVQYNYKQNEPFKVQLVNTTTRPITVPPRAIICELTPVTETTEENNVIG